MIHHGPSKLFLVAVTEIDEKDKASTSLEFLAKSCNNLWEEISTH